MSDLFNAVHEEFKRTKPGLKRRAMAELLADAVLKRQEIDVIRADRAKLRSADTRRGDRNMAMVVLDMHPLELAAIKLLCPLLAAGNSRGAKEGWQWVLKQPWAEELKGPPMEKRFF